MTKVSVATGNDTGLPDGTGMETFAFVDGGVGGYSAIVDPANPTRALTPAADGSIPVTMAAVPTGGATSAKQDTGNASLTSLDAKAPALGQALAAASVPVVLPAAQITTLTPPAAITGFATSTLQGALTETAPATDTASSGLNGRLQRVAQRITSLIALFPAALGAGGGLKVDGSGTALPVSAASLPLPSGAATEATLDARTGALTETAPASDTASSGINGRLQRIAQRLSSMIALLPTALGAGGGLKVDGSGTALPVSGTVTASVAAKAIKWEAGPVSRSTVLTTELNALANGAFSAVGSALDNTANSDQYGALDIVLSSLNPTAGAYLNLYLVQSLDGTTYEDAPSATNPGTHMLVANVLVTTGSAAKRIMTPWFYIPPGKFKFVLLNATNVALGATTNTVTLYTSNDEAQ